MRQLIGMIAVILVPIWMNSALAQRGTGERQGIARQADRPEVQSIEGTLREVKTGPCEHTTGRSPVGTHLMLEGKDANYNLHLGPESEVQDVVKLAKIGEKVAATAFRTDRHADEHYVAVTVMLGDEEIRLRDAALRPRWAGRDGRGGGQTAPRGSGGQVDRGDGPRLVTSRVLRQAGELQLSEEQVKSIESIVAEAEQRIREMLTEEQLQTLASQQRGGQGRRRGQR